MSFLEKEDEGKQSSVWDWVVGIGLVVVIGGFTVFYQYQKRSSHSRFEQADALYKAGNLKDAGKMYEELKSAQYLTTHDDSTIYARMDTIETTRELQALLVNQCKAKASADPAAVREALKAIRYPEILSDEDKGWVDSVMAAPMPVAAPAPAASASAPATPASPAKGSAKAPAKSPAKP